MCIHHTEHFRERQVGSSSLFLVILHCQGQPGIKEMSSKEPRVVHVVREYMQVVSWVGWYVDPFPPSYWVPNHVTALPVFRAGLSS